MRYDYVKSLIDQGYNVIPINADKRPKRSWKEYQDNPVTTIQESDHYALICGYADIECIDVDLKVLPSKAERDAFFNELISLIEQQIEDYKRKLIIKRTVSGGYHLIYRAKNIEGNQKLAYKTGYQEAIIETRGIGGYICMYDDIINLDYHQLAYVTDDERNAIIDTCRILNEVEHQDDVIHIPAALSRQYTEVSNETPPWEDYNHKHSIFDIIGVEFSIIKDRADKTLIKRIGAKSAHSGYVFKNSGCMYLFSTGTIYPAQKLVSPFQAYAIKNFSGNFSQAASALYSQGYGDRKKPTLHIDKVIKEPQKFNSETFPIEIFPREIQTYILAANQSLNASIDYMGGALLWMGSICIGNSIRVEIKKGWEEISTVWVALVGAAGIGKTPSTIPVLQPLERINSEERKRYAKQKKDHEAYLLLSKKDKETALEVPEPKRSYFIVDDITIESLINTHTENPNGVGIFKDELAGWFKDMNKYKAGSDKEQWLSSWSGKGISVDRISRQSDYISKPILPVIGGIQPSILQGFFTDENKESGFIDRMLFIYPDLKINYYNEVEMDDELIAFYNDFTLQFYQTLKKIATHSSTGEIMPHIAKFNADGKKEWIRIFNKITDLQNSDDINEYMVPFLSKQKSYIPRFALIINAFKSMIDGSNALEISADSVKKAEQLSNYFVYMYEKLIKQNLEEKTLKEDISSDKNDTRTKVANLYAKDPAFNRSIAARELNVSKRTIFRIIKELEK